MSYGLSVNYLNADFGMPHATNTATAIKIYSKAPNMDVMSWKKYINVESEKNLNMAAASAPCFSAIASLTK